MNSINFLRLIKTIYFDRKPDLALIQRLGLLAVKIGQIYALRPDFIGDERARVLTRLYSNAEQVPAADAVALIGSYAGDEYLKNFVEFNTSPFAAASIGQAHHAVLKNGERVVMKVVKKDVARQLVRDARRIKGYFKIATVVYPKLRGVANPVVLIEQIEKMTLNELNLRHEVAGQRVLEKIRDEQSGRVDFAHLHFRKIYEELSSENILVTEYAEGETIDELLNRGAFSYEAMLEFFHLHGFFIFGVGTFHGDIHPGNIVYHDGCFTFLDTGCIGHVVDRMRKGLFNFFDALSRDDFHAAAVCLNAMAESGISGNEYERFEKRFLELYAEFPGKTVSEVSLTQQMMATIRLGVLSGMHFDEGMYDIIKSLMFLDGMVIRANPDAVLLKDMRRFIRDFSEFVK